MNRWGGGARGQATLELALVLPLLLTLVLFVVQLGLVVRDQVMVVNAAREGARRAAVDPSTEVARAAAAASGALDPRRLAVGLVTTDTSVTVTVTYRSPTAVPIVGALVDDVVLRESTTMYLEAT